jgi:hypothetical protein
MPPNALTMANIADDVGQLAVDRGRRDGRTLDAAVCRQSPAKHHDDDEGRHD